MVATQLQVAITRVAQITRGLLKPLRLLPRGDCQARRYHIQVFGSPANSVDIVPWDNIAGPCSATIDWRFLIEHLPADITERLLNWPASNLPEVISRSD